MNPIKKFIYNNIIPIVGRIFRYKNKFINVIYYHDIVSNAGNSFQQTNIDTFMKQMNYLVEHGYETVRFDDLKSEYNEIYNPKRIIIAFDDGWKSNYEKIYDYMKSKGLKYNIYLTVKEIGINPDYLTWEQVRLMHDEGCVGFGAHTYTHPHIDRIDNIDPKIEFEKANSIFKRKLGYEPMDFCYPYGTYTEDTNDWITTHLNYKRIYTSRLMYSYRQNGKLIFGRNGINTDETFGVFKAKVNGYFNVWRTILG